MENDKQQKEILTSQGNDCQSKKGISRRRMLVSTAALTALALSDYGINRVNAYSKPSNLKITDIRACLVATNFDYPIIRIDTNQDIYGLGDVRDGGLMGQALILKPFLVGKDPMNIVGIINSIKQYAGEGRLGGGFSAIDMALHDITGKALSVPAYQLVGTKLMDRVRMYCDAESHPDPQQYAKRMLRRKQKGYTYFKMDLTQNLLQGKPDTLIGSSPTDKGLAEWRKYIISIRDTIGWDVPLGADHTGNLTVNDAIRLGNAIEDLQLAFLEDIILDWHKTAALKKVTDTINVPTLHGENAFGLEGFKRWFVDPRSVDMIHPDMATSGGILETHLIGMEADRNDMPIFFHHAGSPVGSIASVHCACTLPNFVAMENHAVDIPWWDDLVTGLPNPIIQQGYITVPEKPGLGLDLNEEVIREHLRIPGYFESSIFYDYPQVGNSPRGPYPHLDPDGNWTNER